MDELYKEAERYRREIRKYPTDKLLEFFSKMSIKSYNKDKNGIVINSVRSYNKKTGTISTTENFVYGQWELVEICYDSIMYSNDYRGKDVNESSFIQLLNERKKYKTMLEHMEEMDQQRLIKHLLCMANLQFDFQQMSVVNRFNRMYQMMININSNKKYCQTKEVCYINFKEKFKQITNIELDTFIDVLFFLVVFSQIREECNIYDFVKYISSYEQKVTFKEEDLKAVIELLSKDYKFYKELNTNNWNMLKFHPIVRTEKDNNYIITNIYALVLSFAENIYWIIRDYYNTRKSNDFLVYFGKCFEFYLEEMFNYYNIKSIKLEESKKQRKKMPDWRIETKKYIILIEQKSSLLPINARIITEEERYKAIEGYIDNNIVKAFKQLDSYTDKNEGKNKIVIRICLMLEKIYFSENVKYIVEGKMNFTSNKYLNWIVNIDEFEILMELLSKNEDEFNKVIEEKIKLEKEECREGRSFEKILRKGTSNYSYKVIDNFGKCEEKLSEKLKGK